MIVFDLPGVRLVGAKNDRSHWAARAARVRQQRWAARCAAQSHGVHQMRLPVEITIVRCGPGTLDDDNLAIACSSVRDGIADAFDLPKHDRDPRVTWRCKQERARKWSVRVEARERGEEAA